MKKVIDIYFGARSNSVIGGSYADIVTIAPHSGTIDDIIASLTSSKSRWVAIRMENDNIQYINVDKILWFQTRDMKDDREMTAEEREKAVKRQETDRTISSIFGNSF